MTSQLVSLHSALSSLVIECPADGPPLWRHWGPRLAGDAAAGPPLRDLRPAPSFSLDQTAPFSVLPTFGLGWFGQSGLLAHRQGQDFAQGFGPAQVEWTVPGAALKLHLDDPVARIGAVVSITLTGEVLTLSTRIENRGDAPLELHWLAAACLPLPDHAARVRSYSGRHNAEWVQQDEALGRAQWRKENRRGLTSHDAFPGAVVLGEGAGAHHGPAWGAQLAWSGNHAQTIEWLDDGRYQWQLGEWLAPGEVALAPGAALGSPEVLAVFSPQGWNGVASAFHGAIRANMDWPGGAMKPRPVHLNSWEGYYFDHDLPRMIALADAAADVGVERFILDDGWFAGRSDDTSSLGDWRVDAAKYPQGLKPLADHVVARGMEFGLWVEPEMVNPDSDLLRAHPDWALQIAGRPLATARNQLVLDLTRPEVSDYLFTSLMDVLAGLPLAYIKWDHNRDLAPAAGQAGRAIYRAQVQAAYALFDRFRTALPQVEIEACAGGGGRIDAGIARRTHRFWTSDCIDAVSRLAMQPGFLQFMPPELMGSHVGTAPAHSTGRTQALDFRAAVALQGHFGLEFDLVRMAADDRARLGEWIAFYKAWRHLLHAQVWTGKGADGMVWHAAGSTAEWLLIAYRLTPAEQRHAPSLRLPFAAQDADYTVSRIDPGAPVWSHVFGGSWLAEAGLPQPPMQAESAVIWHGAVR